MIRLKRIRIKGFKDPEAVKDLSLAEGDISVIYGKNGSGKTTLLRILFAFLNQDERVLEEENVQKMDIFFCEQLDNKRTEGKSTAQLLDNGNYDWFNYEALANFYTINLDILRGNAIAKKDFASGIIMNKTAQIIYSIELSEFDLRQTNELLAYKIIRTKDDLSSVLDDLPEGVSLGPSVKALNNIYQLLKKLAQSFDMLLSKGSSTKDIPRFKSTLKRINLLKEQLEQVFISKSSLIAYLLSSGHLDLKNISIQDVRDLLIEAYNQTTEKLNPIIPEGQSKVFDSVQERIEQVEPITHLLSTFNRHLYDNKELVVNRNTAFIRLASGLNHPLEKLSSGERHLLSILSAVLLLGHQHKLILIDEPEISLNISWQRNFIPLLQQMNKNAQIIVASHSPSIPNRKSETLVELL